MLSTRKKWNIVILQNDAIFKGKAGKKINETDLYLTKG